VTVTATIAGITLPDKPGGRVGTGLARYVDDVVGAMAHRHATSRP
jgi:hypothetical protein